MLGKKGCRLLQDFRNWTGSEVLCKFDSSLQASQPSFPGSVDHTVLSALCKVTNQLYLFDSCIVHEQMAQQILDHAQVDSTWPKKDRSNQKQKAILWSAHLGCHQARKSIEFHQLITFLEKVVIFWLPVLDTKQLFENWEGKFQLIDTALEKWSLHTVASRSFNPIHSYSIILNTYTLHTHKCTQMSSHDFTCTLHHQWQGICFCSVYNWIHWWSLKTTSHDQVLRVCMMYGHNIHRMLCIVFWTHFRINRASKH